MLLAINVDAALDDPMANDEFNVRHSYDADANSTGEYAREHSLTTV